MKKTSLDLVRRKKNRQRLLIGLVLLFFSLVSCGGDDDYSVETSAAQHTVMFDGGNHADINLFLGGKGNVLHGEAAIREIKRQLDARVAECSPELQAAAKNVVFVIVNDFCFRWVSGANSGLAVGAYYPSMGMIKVSLYNGWRGNQVPGHNHAPHTLRDDQQMVTWSGGDPRWKSNKFYSGNIYPPDGRFPSGKLMMAVEHELRHVLEAGYHAKEDDSASIAGETIGDDIGDDLDTDYVAKRIYDDQEGAWAYFTPLISTDGK